MSIKQDKLARLTGIEADAIPAIMQSWQGQKSKTLALAMIDLSIEEARTKIEKCSPEELTGLQGRISGLRIARGNLEFKGEQKA